MGIVLHSSSHKSDLVSEIVNTTWRNIDDDHNITLTLDETSQVIIVYTMDYQIVPSENGLGVRAWINELSTWVHPGPYGFQATYATSSACHFYMDLPSETYTIHMQWRSFGTEKELRALNRALTAFAIPNNP